MQPLFRRAPPFVSPLTAGRLPLALRMLVAAGRVGPRSLRGPARRGAKAWFRWLHCALGLPLRGEVRLALPDRTVTLPFDGRNTQFGALYLPEHAAGYEAPSLAVLDAIVGCQGCFFDVGSNFGYFSLSLAARAGFEGRIHAFEPFPPSFADLADLVARSGLGGAIVCHRLAPSNRDGEARLECDAVHSGLARLGGGKDGPTVAVARLDALDLPPPDAIKIDVEGHETQVLEGARRILAEVRPAVLFESLRLAAPARTLEPFRRLHELGYVFFLPAFRVEDGGHRFFVDSPWPEAKAGTAPILSLVPYRPDERLLLDRDVNVLAWPEERLAALAERFDGRP